MCQYFYCCTSKARKLRTCALSFELRCRIPVRACPCGRSRGLVASGIREFAI